ncbi:uncharacterized protein LOC129596468 isoform X2 [Paramacrobiotus metropolitanus]|uniref:uncharacterized protein LOC129596468 isoform X2 n=1 Tax=Paramacrobiotus metropolitanus TaxID=2943436 RepID=UPI0024465C45|nr:uncharacterized protein LOC129596468 isoform X2 [Paramacrobiotus metropolitanus]XP_055349735.1 uncharacterized protein LOC129596468 isoform X2 [Paramacrobiotus metropolitanus]
MELHIMRYVDKIPCCGSQIRFNCAAILSGEAGTIEFRPVSEDDWQINLDLEKDCAEPPHTFAFYLNIRRINLPSTYRLAMYEYEVESGSRTLVKDLQYFQRTLHDPASISHLLTKYSPHPSIAIEYSRGSAANNPSSFVSIDYVIISNTSSSVNTYCHALSGYVNQEYICDKDGERDRVNCPSAYVPDMGRNPAFGRQCSSTSEDDDSGTNVLDAKTITIIAIGSVFVALVVIFSILSMVARRNDSNALPVPADGIFLISTGQPH